MNDAKRDNLNQALKERKLTIEELYEDSKKFKRIDYGKVMAHLIWVEESDIILAFKKVERKIKIQKINEST